MAPLQIGKGAISHDKSEKHRLVHCWYFASTFVHHSINEVGDHVHGPAVTQTFVRLGVGDHGHIVPLRNGL